MGTLDFFLSDYSRNILKGMLPVDARNEAMRCVVSHINCDESQVIVLLKIAKSLDKEFKYSVLFHGKSIDVKVNWGTKYDNFRYDVPKVICCSNNDAYHTGKTIDMSFGEYREREAIKDTICHIEREISRGYSAKWKAENWEEESIIIGKVSRLQKYRKMLYYYNCIDLRSDVSII